MIRALLASEASKCVVCGQMFFAEGKMPGGFVPEEFTKNWSSLIANNRGAIHCMFDGETPVGAIGGILAPELNNGRMMAVEAFFFVQPEYRSGFQAIRLLDAYEKWAVNNGAQSISLVHLESLQPDRLKKLYERRGYSLMETAYHKEIIK